MLQQPFYLIFSLSFIFIFIECKIHGKFHKYDLNYSSLRTTPNIYTRIVCLDHISMVRARHKSCFLRPDTGPCRADIMQWYFDVRKRRCFRFFWGGCQGNGNRFETRTECMGHCYLNTSDLNQRPLPHFCKLTFDFGTCFGHFERYHWDSRSEICRKRIYSGCGGNQNNFETREECYKTCLTPPNNTFNTNNQHTTCIPYQVPEFLKK